MPTISYRGRDVDAIEVSFSVEREDWNTYHLQDGSELRMRLVVSEVLVVPGEYDAEGNPAYVVKSQNLLVAKSPDNLKRPSSRAVPKAVPRWIRDYRALKRGRRSMSVSHSPRSRQALKSASAWL